MKARQEAAAKKDAKALRRKKGYVNRCRGKGCRRVKIQGEDHHELADDEETMARKMKYANIHEWKKEQRAARKARKAKRSF